MDPSPKVLIVDLSKHYGGSSSRVLSLMARARPGTMALAGLKAGAITSRALERGFPVHVLAHGKADPRILPRLVRLIRGEGYNVLDSQNIQSKFWASLAALITRTALVSTIHSWYASEHGEASIRGRLYTWLELATNPGLDMYITVSERDRQSLIESGIPGEAIALIYNTVDGVDPSAIDGDENWLRAKLGLPSNAIVCAAVGRLVRVKGYDILITAIQKAALQAPELVCLIVGEGQCREELAARIRQAGLEGRVRLTGYQDRQEVMSILKSSDIFVMPSRYEGTPVALLEAAALARPILASACGGIPELVRDGEEALLVPAGDPDALAEGLVRLATDREFARMLGRNAQLRVRREFDPDAQVSATWQAYRKALELHNRREK